MSDGAAEAGGERLRRLLRRLHGRGYPAYKELRGSWPLGALTLHVDHVQGDPFAAPSRLRLRWQGGAAAWPAAWLAPGVARVALGDWLARRVREAIPRLTAGRRGSGASGRVEIDAGGQEILERSAVALAPDHAEARLLVGLPAAGRRVLGPEAEALLLDELPALAREALAASAAAVDEAAAHVACAENHAALQAALAERGLVAFAADGAVLPRESGASQRPLAAGARPLVAPESLRVTLRVPHPVPGADGAPTREVSGLGIPAGVTLVVGGGYHGKSTLLRAFERGIHPHVPGDGRERVAALPDAVKLRAEDGRRVEATDISGFVGALPGGRDTAAFRSDAASGSTSQAANLVEALEAGCRLLLIDEDTCAANFMVRDARMQALVAKQDEPIHPFLDRVRELHRERGVSTLLVMGASGEAFDVADAVIEMREFRPHDVTAVARRVAAEQPSGRRREALDPLPPPRPRVPLATSLDPSRGRRAVKLVVRDRSRLGFGEQEIDLRGLEQLVDASQTRAIGHALVLLRERFMGEGVDVAALLDRLDALLDAEGLDALARHAPALARPRRQELAAALNRLRTLRVAPG